MSNPEQTINSLPLVECPVAGEYVNEWTNCINTLSELFVKHKTNPFIINKINTYMSNLNAVVDRTIRENEERSKKKEKLDEEKSIFTKKFLQTHNYSYISNREMFFNYDGIHYNIYNEDDIHHEILKSITDGEILKSIKHKIKLNIIKQIKDRSPLSYIPESITIQNVINYLYPSVFSDKDSAKYFLTVIGDNILRKNENLIYIISPKIIDVFKEIGIQAYALLGITHILNNIKYKYYDHSFQDCRLLSINNVSKKITIDQHFYKHIIDFFCVACHYSTRYGNADEFLENCNNSELVEHILYLKQNNLKTIIDLFVDKTLEKCNGISIKWRNMMFLWKHYLDTKNIPSIAFNSKLKLLFTQKLEYNEELNSFVNITSTQLPMVSNFLKFWDETMVKDENETELEVEEVCNLFKHWCGKGCFVVNEDIILDLVQHFYNDIIIDDDKFIQQITCKLWDKKADIITAIEDYKQKQCIDNNKFSESLYQVYEYYCKLYANKQFIVGKRYFEKFAIDYIGKQYIDNDNLISNTWWETI
jgi:hypothetical protein